MNGYLTEERDGQGFVDWVLSSDEAQSKWLQNLCEAERQGAIKFARLLELWRKGQLSGFPFWLAYEIHRMQQQEAQHYTLVKKALMARNLPEIQRAPKPEKISEMFIAEQRAVMRFQALLTRIFELDEDIYNIAHKILPDEAYHVVICQELVKHWADVEI